MWKGKAVVIAIEHRVDRGDAAALSFGKAGHGQHAGAKGHAEIRGKAIEHLAQQGIVHLLLGGALVAFKGGAAALVDVVDAVIVELEDRLWLKVSLSLASVKSCAPLGISKIKDESAQTS